MQSIIDKEKEPQVDGNSGIPKHSSHGCLKIKVTDDKKLAFYEAGMIIIQSNIWWTCIPNNCLKLKSMNQERPTKCV